MLSLFCINRHIKNIVFYKIGEQKKQRKEVYVMKYIKKEELKKFYDRQAICIEFPDGSDAMAQDNGYTLEQCLAMDDVKFFLD